MELYQMKFLIVLSQERSFSNAANKLCITQSALSQQIKKVESETGFHIFDRTTKTFNITAKGAEFIERVEKVYDEYESLQKWIASVKTQKLEISLGASEYTWPFAKIGVEQFINKYPSSNVETYINSSPELLDALRYGTIDYAIIGLPKSSMLFSDLNITNLCKECICVAAAPEFIEKGKEHIEWSELAGKVLMVRSSIRRVYSEVKTELANAGVEAQIIAVESLEDQFKLVRQGNYAVIKSNAVMFQKQGFTVLPVEPEVYTEFALVSLEQRKKTEMDDIFVSMIRDAYNTAPRCTD